MRFSEGPSWEQRSRTPRIHEINAWNAALHSDSSLAEQASAGVVYRPEVLLAEQFLATRNKSQFALKGLDPPLKARTWIGNQCRNLS
jgi:hypothetical protein